MTKRIDLVGMTFGRLSVQLLDESHSGGKPKWLCTCSCGGVKSVRGSHLTGGKIVSCGCHNKEVARNRWIKHGMTDTPTHVVWRSMIQRCVDQNVPAFKNYGGRGIKVCARWSDNFLNFLSDMGQRPAGKSIDRINVDGDYEPGNCRWATVMEQAQNKRNSRLVTLNGVTKCATAWAREIGMSEFLLFYRLNAGWSDEKALTFPINHR